MNLKVETILRQDIIKKAFKVLICGFALQFGMHTYASCSELSCIGKVDRLYMPNADYLYVGTDADEKALKCSAISNVYIKLARSHKNFKEIYSVLLLSQTTGKDVKVRVVDDTGQCFVSYVSTY